MREIRTNSKHFADSGEKNGSASSRSNSENKLESIKSKTFSDVSIDNAIGLARGLCVLANWGLAQAMSRDDTSRGANRLDAGEWMLKAFDLLSKAGWQLNLDVEQVRLLCLGREAQIEQKAAVFVADGMARETAIPLIAAADECVELGRALFSLTTLGKCIVDGGLSVATLNMADGNVQLHQGRPRPLGPYQNILERVLTDRRIDKRRFARCAVCEIFFYKPRHKSQACSRKCEDVLMSRAHYHREKERQQKVLELCDRGKRVSDIASELGLEADKIRRYIKAASERKRMRQ